MHTASLHRILALCMVLSCLLAACTTPPSAPPQEEPAAQSSISPTRRTHLILQIDNGGLDAITPTPLLAEIERALASRSDPATRTPKTAFSICFGTGVGAIAAGMTAAGVPAATIVSYHEKTIPNLLAGPGKAKFPIGPKYRRDRFQAELFEVLKTDCGCGFLTLNDLYSAPLLLIPAYDLRSRRTHLFRTRDPGNIPLEYNSDLELVDVISAAAFSGPAFGTFSLPKVTWDQKSPSGALIRKHGARYRHGSQSPQESAIALTAPNGILTAWAHQLRPTDQIALISLGGSHPDNESLHFREALTTLLKRHTHHVQVFRFTEITRRPDLQQLLKDHLRSVPLVPATPIPDRPRIVKDPSAKLSL